MKGKQFAELAAFVAVARQHSFSRAAGDLGVSTPAVSQIIRALEDKLEIRLLNRTTRSVATTEAGEQFLCDLEPLFEGVEKAIEGLASFRDQASGRLRIRIERRSAVGVVAPIVAAFAERYPRVSLEAIVDESDGDIVAGRFDAGIRRSDLVDRDMIAIRLGGERRMAVVAAPRLLLQHAAPRVPADLRLIPCVRVRRPDGRVERWEFENGRKRAVVPVEGPVVANDADLAIAAAAGGAGVAYVPHDLAEPLIRECRLVALLEDWSITRPGFSIYYSSRRQLPPPLRAFIDVAKESNGRAAHELLRLVG